MKNFICFVTVVLGIGNGVCQARESTELRRLANPRAQSFHYEMPEYGIEVLGTKIAALPPAVINQAVDASAVFSVKLMVDGKAFPLPSVEFMEVRGGVTFSLPIVAPQALLAVKQKLADPEGFIATHFPDSPISFSEAVAFREHNGGAGIYLYIALPIFNAINRPSAVVTPKAEVTVKSLYQKGALQALEFKTANPEISITLRSQANPVLVDRDAFLKDPKADYLSFAQSFLSVTLKIGKMEIPIQSDVLLSRSTAKSKRGDIIYYGVAFFPTDAERTKILNEIGAGPFRLGVPQADYLQVDGSDPKSVRFNLSSQNPLEPLFGGVSAAPAAPVFPRKVLGVPSAFDDL